MGTASSLKTVGVKRGLYYQIYALVESIDARSTRRIKISANTMLDPTLYCTSTGTVRQWWYVPQFVSRFQTVLFCSVLSRIHSHIWHLSSLQSPAELQVLPLTLSITLFQMLHYLLAFLYRAHFRLFFIFYHSLYGGLVVLCRQATVIKFVCMCVCQLNHSLVV